MKEDKTNPWWAVFGLPAAVLVMLYGAAAKGYVLGKIWVWYALPLGAPALHWKVFAAALLFWATVKGPKPEKEPGSGFTKQDVQNFITACFWPWILLAAAWCLR